MPMLVLSAQGTFKAGLLVFYCNDCQKITAINSKEGNSGTIKN